MSLMKRLGLTLLPLLLAATLQAQDLPDGPGKDTVEKTCTACHDLSAVVSMSGSADIWQSVADDMKSRGADGTHLRARQFDEGKLVRPRAVVWQKPRSKQSDSLRLLNRRHFSELRQYRLGHNSIHVHHCNGFAGLGIPHSAA